VPAFVSLRRGVAPEFTNGERRRKRVNAGMTMQNNQAPEKKRIVFLILALAFLAVIILDYLFQDALYDIAYSDRYFILILLLALPAALFCIVLYNSPRLAAELFGGKAGVPQERKTAPGGISYNVYAEAKPSAVAHHHHRWKAARRERRRVARAEKAKGKPKGR